MTSGEAPGLNIGPFADQFLQDASEEEKEVLWRIFFSLLLEPEPDNIRKFEADYYPYTGRGVREYKDDSFLIPYREDDIHSVHILRIFRIRDLP